MSGRNSTRPLATPSSFPNAFSSSVVADPSWPELRSWADAVSIAMLSDHTIHIAVSVAGAGGN